MPVWTVLPPHGLLVLAGILVRRLGARFDAEENVGGFDIEVGDTVGVERFESLDKLGDAGPQSRVGEHCFYIVWILGASKADAVVRKETDCTFVRERVSSCGRGHTT